MKIQELLEKSLVVLYRLLEVRMRLKDILELGTYGLEPESKVEIFDMEEFENAIMHGKFSEIYIPTDEESDIYPYAFLVNDSILIAMEA